MKTLLIIYPHWFPSNLAGVHRPRLIGNYLKYFNYKVKILTIKEEFFEEIPDYNFEKFFSPEIIVTRVDAYRIGKPRVIGDLGLRGFIQLYKKALVMIDKEEIDFIWLPIPSFYNAVLGRLIYDKTQIPYGIDYIDPWVRDITNQTSIRSKISQIIARFLEPFAVKKASLITGVSQPYYQGVLNRNFPTMGNLKVITNPNTGRKFTHAAMPYGFDKNDYSVISKNIQFPWRHDSDTKIWVYAGAFLPNSHLLLEAMFKSISKMRKINTWDNKINLWFIGTGNYPSKSIITYATENGIEDIVYEKRERYPYLDVLNFLKSADTLMIIGSTEEHYTASKTFQSLLSNNPIVAVFHYLSSAVKVMEACEADSYMVRFNPKFSQEQLIEQFITKLTMRLKNDTWDPNLNYLDKFSAKESARVLIEAIEIVL